MDVLLKPAAENGSAADTGCAGNVIPVRKLVREHHQMRQNAYGKRCKKTGFVPQIDLGPENMEIVVSLRLNIVVLLHILFYSHFVRAAATALMSLLSDVSSTSSSLLSSSAKSMSVTQKSSLPRLFTL